MSLALWSGGNTAVHKDCILTYQPDVRPRYHDIVVSAEKSEEFRSSVNDYRHKTGVFGVYLNIVNAPEQCAVALVYHLLVTKLSDPAANIYHLF